MSAPSCSSARLVAGLNATVRLQDQVEAFTVEVSSGLVCSQAFVAYPANQLSLPATSFSCVFPSAAYV